MCLGVFYHLGTRLCMHRYEIYDEIYGRTRLVAGLTPGIVPIGESEPLNERVDDSAKHKTTQQAIGNVSNIA